MKNCGRADERTDEEQMKNDEEIMTNLLRTDKEPMKN